MRRVMIGLGSLFVGAWLFPGWQLDGTGPVSIRGQRPYHYEVELSLGAFKPWLRFGAKDTYNGSTHTGKWDASWKSSSVFLLGPAGAGLVSSVLWGFQPRVILRFRT